MRKLGKLGHIFLRISLSAFPIHPDQKPENFEKLMIQFRHPERAHFFDSLIILFIVKVKVVNIRNLGQNIPS